jgi:hypothetical protein
MGARLELTDFCVNPSVTVLLIASFLAGGKLPTAVVMVSVIMLGGSLCSCSNLCESSLSIDSTTLLGVSKMGHICLPVFCCGGVNIMIS